MNVRVCQCKRRRNALDRRHRASSSARAQGCFLVRDARAPMRSGALPCALDAFFALVKVETIVHPALNAEGIFSCHF